jgi:hypothetical protein
MGVSLGGTGVSVGGATVISGVSVAEGTGVLLGAGVLVGGTGVSVGGTTVISGVSVADGRRDDAVLVGGTGVSVGSAATCVGVSDGGMTRVGTTGPRSVGWTDADEAHPVKISARMTTRQ